MDLFLEPFSIALAHWWQIGVTIIGCVVAICLTDHFNLSRSWPLPVMFGGILSLMIMEAYPHAWILGQMTPVVLWVILSCMSYYLPDLNRRLDDFSPVSLWDFFEVVDTNEGFDFKRALEKGD